MNDKTNTENRFLEEGIKRYEEARDTIIAFEREMETLLDEVVANRQNWKPLKRKDTKPASASTSFQFGYWISIEINGKSPRGEGVVLDCGLWWKNGVDDNPLVYASYYHKPKDICNFSWKDKGSDVRHISRWKRAFLYLPFRKPEEIEGSLNRVLDSLLKQLK
jgi:hypothetical protein